MKRHLVPGLSFFVVLLLWSPGAEAQAPALDAGVAQNAGQDAGAPSDLSPDAAPGVGASPREAPGGDAGPGAPSTQEAPASRPAETPSDVSTPPAPDQGEPVESAAPWEQGGDEPVPAAADQTESTQTDTGSKPGLQLGGMIETSFFLGLDHGQLFDFHNVNVLRLTLKGNLNEHLRGAAQLELRNTNFTAVSSSADLGDRGKVDPISFRLDEAYIEYIGLFIDAIDLKVGRQRFAWGTADGFHPTNPIDPYNLEIPIDFKERLGATAISISANLPHEISLTAALIPLFTPSLFPTNVLAMPLPVDIPQGVTLGKTTDTIETPEAKLKNLMVATRLAWNVFDFDMSLSYYYGRDTLPALVAADATVTSISPPAFDVDARLIYPRMQQIGFDFTGSPFDVGFWGEMAVVFPEKVEAQFTVMGKPIDLLTGKAIPPTTVIDDTPFVRVVAGIDYTFTGGYYFNIQYIHGFFVERTSDALQDYVIGAFRKKLFQDKLELEMMGGIEIDDSDHLGWLAGGELRYLPFDSGRIVLGGLVARGDEGTTLDLFRGLEQVYLRFRLDF